MNLLNKTLFLMVVSLVSTQLYAGDKVGNGGVGMICQKPQSNKIDRVRLLDFWEAEELVGIKGSINLVSSSDSVETQIDRALDKLSQIEGAEKLIRAALKKVIYRPIQKGAQLPNSNDTDAYISGQWNAVLGCQEVPRNIVSYRENIDVYFYNEELGSRLSNTEQAALRLHEALYRLSGLEDSRVTRRIVALLFSNLDHADLLEALIRQFILKDGAFFIPHYQSSDALTFEIEFTYIGVAAFFYENPPFPLTNECTKAPLFHGRKKICSTQLMDASSLLDSEAIQPAVDFMMDASGGIGSVLEFTMRIMQGERVLYEKDEKMVLSTGGQRRMRRISPMPGRAFEYVYLDSLQ